jgi:hypothetical protein
MRALANFNSSTPCGFDKEFLIEFVLQAAGSLFHLESANGANEFFIARGAISVSKSLEKGANPFGIWEFRCRFHQNGVNLENTN